MVWLLISFPFSSNAQKKSTNNPSSGEARLNQILEKSVRHFADSTLQSERQYSDSLQSALALTAMATAASIDALTDSLIRSAHDSLDASRKDTLRFMTTMLRRQVLAAADTAKQAMNGLLAHFVTEVTRCRSTFSACNDCEVIADVNDRFEQFRDFVDLVLESFRDTVSTVMDDRRDALQDRFETVRDSLIDLRDQLIEHRLGEIDYQRYEATRLTISTGYASHTVYRGRDNGVAQQMIAPSVEFHHASGFGIVASTSWVDQEAKSWDGAAASAMYQFTIGGVFGGGLSYSHFWFSDSSLSSKAVFKNAFGANASLSFPLVSLSLDADLATGSASEFTLSASVSHTFGVPLTLYNDISFQPTLTAIVGEQNSTLTTIRTKGAKAKKVAGATTQTSNSFGILAYEFSLPVTVNLGPVTLAPSLVYTLPKNVIDLSTTSPFFDFELVVSLAIH
jgi:hypothetical protein